LFFNSIFDEIAKFLCLNCFDKSF